MPSAERTRVADPHRLDAVRETGLLDAPPSEALDRLTRLATRLLGVPTALVTLVDRDRQYFASATGLGGALAGKHETSLGYSFCQHVVATTAPLVVRDARVHPLVADNLAVTELGVIAYAGMPLVTSDGRTLGSFCALDETPHEWSQEDLGLLRDLAQAAMTEIELRFASRALGEQGEQLRDLLDHTGDLVCSFDAGGGIVYANRAWIQALRVTQEESALIGVSGLLAGPSRAVWSEAWKRMLEGVPSPHLELVFAPRGRSPVLVEARLTPRIAESAVRGARLICRDVTEQRRVERLKDEVIGIVSHELRTPIGAVRGALQLLGATLPATLGARERMLLDLAGRNTDRLLALVNDLLDLERLEGGAEALALSDLALDQVFTAARDTVFVSAEQAGVVLRVEPTAARVKGDAARLTQVLVNLVANAVKFTPRGGRVTVDAVPDGTLWRVRVADEGRGIPADELERVFERFSQVERRDATEKGGSGLGLPIARAIVIQHGGRIWAESTPGSGTTFSFTVPRALD